MKKKKIIFGIIIIMLTIVMSISISYAATTLFASNEVSYAPGTKEITSTNVQGAIDELATYANQYKGLNDSITTLEGYVENIGTYKYHGPNAVSISSGTLSPTGAFFNLVPGTWIIIGTGSFASNATGDRLIGLYTGSSSNNCETNVGIIANASTKAVNGQATIINFTVRQNISSGTTYYLCAQQSSGSSINVTGRLMARRIK